jgi:hypothetical protein
VLVAIGSVKGSPGATTLALALAARWPEPGALVVEADPAGGDTAFRFGHHRSPGVLEWATDNRATTVPVTGSGTADHLVNPYVQRLAAVSVDVVVGPGEPQMAPALRLLKSSGLLGAVAAQRTVLLDAGRLDADSPALPLAAAAEVLLLVTRAWPDALDAISVRRERLLAISGMRAKLAVVLVGDLPYPAREVAQTLALPVIATLPDDPRGVAVLTGQARASRGWTRLPLPRSARSLAKGLSERTLTALPVARGRSVVDSRSSALLAEDSRISPLLRASIRAFAGERVASSGSARDSVRPTEGLDQSEPQVARSEGTDVRTARS